MAEACISCLGPLLGFKKDELYDDDDDDMEDDPQYPGLDEMRKAKKKKKRMMPTPVAESKSDTHGSGGTTRWVKYTDPITVEGGKTQVKQTLNKVRLTGFVNEEFHTVSQVQKLHTLEIIDCGLNDLPPGLKEGEYLAVLCISRNRLTKFAEELKDCKNIESIIFDHNKIEDFPPGVFSARSFKKLKVLNLSYNRSLAMLPQDFGSCGSAEGSPLLYIDLSHCALRALPDQLFTNCCNLQTLNVSHNSLRRLPSIPTYGSSSKFVKIEKLFVSFNELEVLPEEIGTCKALTKIRMVKNNVTRLPESILLLWHRAGGKLDELLVERNPLIMPSITAFEMGSDEQSRIDKAFMLFESQIKLEKEQLAEEERMRALRDEERIKEQQLMVSASKDNMALADEAKEDVPSAEAQAREGHYYFGHCKDDAAVMALRKLESTLLLLKKTNFVQHKIEQLKEMQKSNEVPKHLEYLLREGFNPDKYSDKIPVSDLDLYFNLMVYSTKPMFSRCELLFDQFSAGENSFMTHEEWNELCSSVSIIIPDVVRTSMWRLMAWRHPHDKIQLSDFIAAWHIHDVDETPRDPWIKRITKVLNLDYYDMSVHELQRRLNARDGQEATPQLDFDHIATKPTTGDLEANEGIHRIRRSPLEGSPDDGVERARRRSEEAEANHLRATVELSDAEHVKYNKLMQKDAGDELSDGEASLPSFRSSNLSEDTEAEFGDFDAEMFLQQHEVRRRAMSSAYGGKQSIREMNDDDIKALMEISPEALLEKRNQRQETETLLALEPISRAHRMPRVTTDHLVDPDLSTDVHSVRQGIRAVYRNLPFGDFVKLINFLLRGMQLIKHSPKESLTYWHADDPTFKHTMGAEGTNRYTRALLGKMGFVLLADVYWVWPSVHLELDDGVPTWARKEVPATCPGRTPNRLDDMIVLFRSCQRTLHREGREKFRGHFQTEKKF